MSILKNFRNKTLLKNNLSILAISAHDQTTEPKKQIHLPIPLYVITSCDLNEFPATKYPNVNMNFTS